MATLAGRETPVAKKKTEGKAKRFGTLIRVSNEFADAMSRASSFEKISMAKFADKHLLAIVEKRYRDAVLKEARRMEGQGQ